jgi:translation initiation factor IF-2
MERPPIVVVMGHVDHGKTTLLDYIRKTNVASREAGGITQSIGAYEIEHNGKWITFIDTPGHEAFSRMRYYGAHVADIAILVVAADDGVKPQTKDALKYILDAKIPYVVAINKIDKPGADIERTKADLAKSGIYLEGYGGNVSWTALSAKNGEGVKELLDLLLLTAEIEDLSTDSEKTSGIVISAKRDPKKGVLVGAVLKNGRLEVGQAIATATASGKIKVIENFLGHRVKSVVPSSPCLILGFEDLPKVGEEFFADDDPKILELAAKKAERKVTTGETREEGKVFLKAVLKADEVSTLEALEEFLKSKEKELPIRVIENSVGNIHESDVKMADNAKAIILGFRVKKDKAAENLIQSRKTPVIISEVIYELEKAIEIYAKNILGNAKKTLEVLKIFGNPKGKEQIVGGRVISGPIKNNSSFEITDGGKSIGTGKILNLQSKRKDTAEVQTGEEAGLLVESDIIIKPGHKLIFD